MALCTCESLPPLSIMAWAYPTIRQWWKWLWKHFKIGKDWEKDWKEGIFKHKKDHGFIPFTFVHFCSLLFTFIHFRLLSFTFVHFCSLLLTFVNFCSLLFTFIRFCSLLFTFVHFHSLSFTFVHFRSLSFTFIHFRSFLMNENGEKLA